MSASNEMTPAPDATSPNPTSGSIFFVGTATVLIWYHGFTILTDHNFIRRHEQVPIGYGMHATQLTNPAVDIHELPSVELVLLSHFHGDHFDQVAERELSMSLPLVTTPQVATELRERGFGSVLALETWSSASSVKGNARLKITSTPGRNGPICCRTWRCPGLWGACWRSNPRTGKPFSSCRSPATS